MEDTYAEKALVQRDLEVTPDRRYSSVDDNSLRLDKAISEAHGLLSTLAERLQPLLAPDRDDMATATRPESGASSALGGRLLAFAESVETLSARLGDLLQRADI